MSIPAPLKPLHKNVDKDHQEIEKFFDTHTEEKEVLHFLQSYPPSQLEAVLKADKKTEQFYTLMQTAVIKGWPTVVPFLHKNGANAKVEDSLNGTLLHLACSTPSKKTVAMIQTLLALKSPGGEAVLKVDALTESQTTPLADLCHDLNWGRTRFKSPDEFAEFQKVRSAALGVLLEAKADPKLVNCNGFSPLMLLAESDANLGMVQHLITESKVDVNVTTEDVAKCKSAVPNQNALGIAAKTNQAEMMRCLLQHKATATIGVALHQAILNEQLQAVTLLLEAKANPDERTEFPIANRDTPLTAAVKSMVIFRRPVGGIVRKLLEHKADIHAKCGVNASDPNEQASALEIASRNPAVLEILRP